MYSRQQYEPLQSLMSYKPSSLIDAEEEEEEEEKDEAFKRCSSDNNDVEYSFFKAGKHADVEFYDTLPMSAQKYFPWDIPKFRVRILITFAFGIEFVDETPLMLFAKLRNTLKEILTDLGRDISWYHYYIGDYELTKNDLEVPIKELIIRGIFPDGVIINECFFKRIGRKGSQVKKGHIPSTHNLFLDNPPNYN